MRRLAFLALIFTGIICGAALAESGRIGPDIPKGIGKADVEDRQFMRIHHMELLKHDRDNTVLLGERKINFSLKQCIACHAVNGADAKPVGIQSSQHFCRSCHDYAAVKIDCFDCHNSKPDSDIQMTFDLNNKDVHKLADYLNRVKQ